MTIAAVSPQPVRDPTSAGPRAAPLGPSLLADARATAAFRGERHEFRSRLDAALQMARLALVSDAFGGQALYRLGSTLRRRRIPLLPALLRRLAIAGAAIYIDERALVHPGLYVVHGQIVIEGPAVIHPRVVIAPAVTVGMGDDGRAPVIGPGVSLGTGARVLGGVTIGARARIGAGSVVLEDVPAGATAVGIPARITPGLRPG